MSAASFKGIEGFSSSHSSPPIRGYRGFSKSLRSARTSKRYAQGGGYAPQSDFPHPETDEVLTWLFAGQVLFALVISFLSLWLH